MKRGLRFLVLMAIFAFCGVAFYRYWLQSGPVAFYLLGLVLFAPAWEWLFSGDSQRGQ